MFCFEYTDTLMGVPRYRWMRRGNLQSATLRNAVRKAKAQCGLTGIRCKRVVQDNMIVLYPYCTISDFGTGTVLFIKIQ